MPRFRCNTEGCEKYGEVELISRVKFVWNETTKKLEASEQICNTCKEVRETLRELDDNGNIAVPWFKPENAKNHNNKKVKQYDYDHEAAKSSTATISTKENKK